MDKKFNFKIYSKNEYVSLLLQDTKSAANIFKRNYQLYKYEDKKISPGLYVFNCVSLV